MVALNLQNNLSRGLSRGRAIVHGKIAEPATTDIMRNKSPKNENLGACSYSPYMSMDRYSK